MEPPRVVALPYQSASKAFERTRSGLGITSFVLVFVNVPLAGVLLLFFAGWSAIAHDPAGDPGGPVFFLGFLALSAVLSILLGILWLLGVIFACAGLLRTRRRCIWSKLGAILHLLLLIAIILVAALEWNFI